MLLLPSCFFISMKCHFSAICTRAPSNKRRFVCFCRISVSVTRRAFFTSTRKPCTSTAWWRGRCWVPRCSPKSPPLWSSWNHGSFRSLFSFSSAPSPSVMTRCLKLRHHLTSAESICDQHCTLNSNTSQTSEILSKSPVTAISVQTFLMMLLSKGRKAWIKNEEFREQ